MALLKFKQGKPLSLETEALVTDFFQPDENSRIIPIMDDFVSIKTADAHFLSQYLEVKISFIKLT